MTILAVIGLLLAYLGIGVVFLLCYILAMKPEPRMTSLGTIGLFWPVILLIDLLLTISGEFGKVGHNLALRFNKGLVK